MCQEIKPGLGADVTGSQTRLFFGGRELSISRRNQETNGMLQKGFRNQMTQELLKFLSTLTIFSTLMSNRLLQE